MYVYRGFALEEGEKNPAFPCINFHSQNLQCHSTFCVEKERENKKKKRSLAAKQKLKAVPCQLVISLSAGVWRCAFTEPVLK